MNTDTNTPAETSIETPLPNAPKNKTTVKSVTSTKTVDFPSIPWGIIAGETRELPEDAGAQASILSLEYITIIK
jgi:hypothetical protein